MTEREELARSLKALEVSTAEAILVTAERVKQLSSAQDAEEFCDGVLRRIAAYRTNLKRLEMN